MFLEFSEDSKVWAFAGDRFFNENEIAIIETHLKAFLPQWAAHGTPLKNDFNIIGNNILLVAVDEAIANASGCSIDALVRKIKEIGKEIKVDFFNRLSITVEKEGEFIKVPFSDLGKHQGSYFYNLNVTKLADLSSNFKTLVV
jgi:hypothetical protein